MSTVLRTRTHSEMRGFMKALVETHSELLHGFLAAGEIIAIVQTAMLAGMPYTGLCTAIFTHPTLAGGLNALFATPPTLARK